MVYKSFLVPAINTMRTANEMLMSLSLTSLDHSKFLMTMSVNGGKSFGVISPCMTLF